MILSTLYFRNIETSYNTILETSFNIKINLEFFNEFFSRLVKNLNKMLLELSTQCSYHYRFYLTFTTNACPYTNVLNDNYPRLVDIFLSNYTE